jgi:hypothetical protein
VDGDVDGLDLIQSLDVAQLAPLGKTARGVKVRAARTVIGKPGGKELTEAPPDLRTRPRRWQAGETLEARCGAGKGESSGQKCFCVKVSNATTRPREYRPQPTWRARSIVRRPQQTFRAATLSGSNRPTLRLPKLASFTPRTLDERHSHSVSTSSGWTQGSKRLYEKKKDDLLRDNTASLVLYKSLTQKLLAVGVRA